MDIKAIGNYNLYLDKLLGKGSLGEVVVGQRISDQQKVAVKIISKQHLIGKQKFYKKGLLKCIQREVVIQQNLKHPNIIQMYEAKETPNNLYMFMEYGDCTLQDYLKTKIFNNDDVRQLMKQLLQALIYMSRAKMTNELQNNKEYYGICHLDLKPQNIVIVDNKPKITDFGMSIYLNDDGPLEVLNTDDELSQTHHFYLGKGSLV